MSDIAFVAEVRISERAGKHAKTKYFRIRLDPKVADLLQFLYGQPLVNYEKVQLTVKRFLKKSKQLKVEEWKNIEFANT